MSEEKKKRMAPRPATYIPKIGAESRASYPEVLAQQFDGEDMDANGFKIEPHGDDGFKTTVRIDGESSADIVHVGDLLCRAEGVQMFVMDEAAFKAVYKRKHS